MTDRERPRLMLALDGGGLLGLISLGILREIEAQLREIRNDPDLRLGQVFDYIGGTSTGAIIAAGLALGKSVEDLRNLYANRGREIFPHWSRNLHRNILSGFSHLYSAEGVSRVLREEIGEGSILEMQRDGRLSRERHLLIIARNKTTNSCWPLSTNPKAHYNDEARADCNLRLPLWQVVRASTAAPFYFPPERIQLDPNDPSRLFHFEDGGLTAHNNPALKLFQLATMPEYGLNWPRGERNMVIISVGTGRNERRRTDIRDRGDGLLALAQRTPGSLMSGISAENDLTCRLIGRCVHGHRLDSEVGDLVKRRPLSDDTGEAFIYARYDADLSDKGLSVIRLSAMDRDLRMDRVASIGLFERIGTEYAREVDLRKHFDGGAVLA